MSEPKDGGPAFGTFKQAGNCAIQEGGMTLRDYFAAKALQGIISFPGNKTMNSYHEVGDSLQIAKAAYRFADAMLAAREVSK